MSINITSRLAKFDELIPSNIPFVEGKLKGHQDRKNQSVIGPGVSEDAKQNVKIAEEHGFNIGAVSAAPMNGSGLHSHTTAEVFIIHSGAWRFYWGVDGTEGEVILKKIAECSLDDLEENLENLYHVDAEFNGFHPINDIK